MYTYIYVLKKITYIYIHIHIHYWCTRIDLKIIEGDFHAYVKNLSKTNENTKYNVHYCIIVKLLILCWLN